jgi:hypothetical protein
MTPLDAPVIQEHEFPDSKRQVHSERLGYESSKEKWPLRTRFLFFVLVISSLWVSTALALGVLFIF